MPHCCAHHCPLGGSDLPQHAFYARGDGPVSIRRYHPGRWWGGDPLRRSQNRYARQPRGREQPHGPHVLKLFLTWASVLDELVRPHFGVVVTLRGKHVLLASSVCEILSRLRQPRQPPLDIYPRPPPCVNAIQLGAICACHYCEDVAVSNCIHGCQTYGLVPEEEDGGLLRPSSMTPKGLRGMCRQCGPFRPRATLWLPLHAVVGGCHPIGHPVKAKLHLH